MNFKELYGKLKFNIKIRKIYRPSKKASKKFEKKYLPKSETLPDEFFERLCNDIIKDIENGDDYEKLDNNCCFIGHSTLPYKTLKPLINKAIRDAVNDGYNFLMTGARHGFELASEKLLFTEHVKRPYFDIFNVIADTKPTPDCTFKEKLTYRKIIKKKGYLISPTIVNRFKDLTPQDLYMINTSRRLITAYDGVDTKTRDLIEYAKQQNIEIVNILKP